MPTKYYHFVCFRLSTYLYGLFVYVSVCAIEQLEIHSPENTNKITNERALACSTFHFIFNFNRYYILKNYSFCHYIRHMGVVKSISRPKHRVGAQWLSSRMLDSRLRGRGFVVILSKTHLS